MTMWREAPHPLAFWPHPRSGAMLVLIQVGVGRGTFTPSLPPASRRTVREPLDSHRSRQVNVVVPNNYQCTNSSALFRASFRKNSEAPVLWSRKRLYFRTIHAFSF